MKIQGMIGMVLLLATSFTVFADDTSNYISSDMCVDKESENCINTVCLTSESTSCTQDCHKMAMEKCKAKPTIEHESDGE